MQERTDFVVDCLGNCLLKSQINRAFRNKFDPDASPATIADYVSRARKQMAESLSRTRQEHAEKVLASLEAIVRNPKTPQQAKVRALEVVARLVGAEEARQFVVRHEDGAERKEDIDRRIDAVFGIVRRPVPATNGNGHPDAIVANGVDTEAQEATA
jgi:hypothetical protein